MIQILHADRPSHPYLANSLYFDCYVVEQNVVTAKNASPIMSIVLGRVWQLWTGIPRLPSSAIELLTGGARKV
jgi:hypothetical protein